MKKTALFITLAWFFTLAGSAQEYVNKQYEFALTFPENASWSAPDVLTQSSDSLPEGVELELHSFNNQTNAVIAIQIIQINDNVTMTKEYIRNKFKEGFVVGLPATMKVIHETVTKIAGADGYKFLIAGTSKGSRKSIRVIMLTTNGFLYTLMCIAFNTTSEIDEEHEEVLTSFRFTSPPKLPKQKK